MGIIFLGGRNIHCTHPHALEITLRAEWRPGVEGVTIDKVGTVRSRSLKSWLNFVFQVEILLNIQKQVAL